MKITPARPRSPRYLSEDERIAIADLLAAGGTVRAIALALGRAPSTVSREVRRNADAHGSYRAHQAERFSRERVRGSRPRRVSEDGVLRAAIQVLLDQRWSPEQVAHELRIRFARRPWRCVCTGTIYQAIYDPAVELTRPGGAASSSSASGAWRSAARAVVRDADDQRAAR